MTNKEIAELVFNKMKSFGFTPYDINYGDGYFVFEMGENSVVHFRIKEVWKNWKFGMWINSDELNNYNEDDNEDTPYDEESNVVQIFCQHEHLIDKFKPSRSALCVDLKPCDFKDDDYTWGNYQLEDMLKMIKYHPIMCWNEFCGKHAGYYNSRSFLIPFLKYESEYMFREVERVIKTTFFLNYTKAKLFLMKRFSKVLSDVKIYDFEKENEGWSTDYLYRIDVTVKDIDDKDIIKFFNFWFKKWKYGIYGLGRFDCVVELNRSFFVEGDNKPYWFDEE